MTDDKGKQMVSQRSERFASKMREREDSGVQTVNKSTGTIYDVAQFMEFTPV